MQLTNAQTHRLRTRKLMRTTLALWTLLAIPLPLMAEPLNALNIPYLDLPLGSFMTTQGALIALLLMLYAFARRQDRIDRDHFLAQS